MKALQVCIAILKKVSLSPIEKILIFMEKPHNLFVTFYKGQLEDKSWKMSSQIYFFTNFNADFPKKVVGGY
jgi:hypothetical protein